MYKGILREASSPALTSLTVVAVGKSCQRVAVRWATVVACKIRRNGAPNPLVETQGGEEEELTGRGWTSSGGAVAGGSWELPSFLLLCRFTVCESVVVNICQSVSECCWHRKWFFRSPINLNVVPAFPFQPLADEKHCEQCEGTEGGHLLEELLTR